MYGVWSHLILNKIFEGGIATLIFVKSERFWIGENLRNFLKIKLFQSEPRFQLRSFWLWSILMVMLHRTGLLLVWLYQMREVIYQIWDLFGFLLMHIYSFSMCHESLILLFCFVSNMRASVKTVLHYLTCALTLTSHMCTFLVLKFIVGNLWII